MKLVNHVVNAVCGASAKDVAKCVTGSPVVGSDVAPFVSFRVSDLKLVIGAEYSDVIANVERSPASELTLQQLKALRRVLRLSFRITNDFVRDLDTATNGWPIGTVPIQTIYEVALRHTHREHGNL